MNEEENIKETADDGPQSAGNENISELQTTNYPDSYREQTEDMEVHKHPHHVTHKKKWGEYLLEFLMLFLAVFLGFVAENIRENIAEHERAKHYATSLYQDMVQDTISLTAAINISRDIGETA